MAFGIDDFLGGAAAAINLTDTLVRTVKNNKGKPGEVGKLINEVRMEAIQRIDEAHEALNQFERLMNETGNLDFPLEEAVKNTPFWRPVESYRLWRAKRSLNAMADSVFKSSEDVNSLVRCMQDTDDTGLAIADSASAKHEFNRGFLDAKTVRQKTRLIREQLDRFRYTLEN